MKNDLAMATHVIYGLNIRANSQLSFSQIQTKVHFRKEGFGLAILQGNLRIGFVQRYFKPDVSLQNQN